MWRKHPLARTGLGLIAVLTATITLVAALVFERGFWQDGQVAPRQLDGHITIFTSRPGPGPVPGRFHFVSRAGEELEFDLKDTLLDLMRDDTPTTPVIVIFSPHSNNIYSLQVGLQVRVLSQYQPDQLFQSWQVSALVFMGLAVLVGLVGLIYSGLGLLDWWWPPRVARGALIARVERTELNSENYSVVLSPFETTGLGRQMPFELRETDFLTTDGVDYLEITHSRLFHWVRQVRPLPEVELPPAVVRQPLDEAVRVRYACGWRFWLFVYGDPALGLLLLGLTVATLLAWAAFQGDADVESARSSVLLIIGLFSLVGALYLFGRFRRKLLDIKRPRRLSVGPVLSKWRVTRTSQENRRLIVIADGGLEAGKDAVRRFDLSQALYDRLQVGDIVEIEHTSQLHFICRLEVKGHQELSPNH